MASFVSKVQRTAKVRRVRKKIRDLKAKQKALSREYKSAVKSESKRLSKTTRKKTVKPKRKTTRRR